MSLLHWYIRQHFKRTQRVIINMSLKKQELMGILNVFLFSFFPWKKKCTKKSFFSVQSNIKTKEAEYFQRDMEAIKTLKYCTSFCLVYNKTRKCRAIERGRCLRTQTHEIFNTSILYYNWFHWDLNPTKKTKIGDLQNCKPR